MRLPVLIRSWSVSLWRNERGVVLAMALVVMVLLMGVGSTALFSGYTNLLTSTNLRLATRARATAEAAVNETLYRLSRQEGKPGAIVPNLANPNWEVHIMPNGSSSAGPPIQVATIQATGDWPHAADTPAVTLRYKKDASGKVIFYDRDPALSSPFRSIALPAPAAPAAGAIPGTAHPVIQIVATGLDEREAERQVLAEATSTTAFAPPAPLSSGVNVDLNGSGFLDGVNHDHRIYITPGSGNSTIYGDNATGGTDEVTDSHSGSVSRDSPDDNKNDNSAPRACGNSGDHNVANPSLTATAYSSCARLFNMQISATDATPAWVGLQWVNPVPSSDPHRPTFTNPHWHGTNTGAASAVALSNGPTVVRDQPPPNNVWTKGVFTWGKNNISGLGTIPPYPSGCSTSTLVCRPASLTPFPTFQQYLGLDDASFQNLLDNPDTTKADLNAGRPPLGFIYIQGDYTFNNSTASPGTDDFGLLYVTGDLTINGNQTFKGLVYIDGSLKVGGSPVILGGVMVHGSTQITVGTGNMKLLYSTKAAELGIQAAHPWRVLSWEDTQMAQ